MDEQRKEVEALVDELLYQWDGYKARVEVWKYDKTALLSTEEFENVRKLVEDRLLSGSQK